MSRPIDTQHKQQPSTCRRASFPLRCGIAVAACTADLATQSWQQVPQIQVLPRWRHGATYDLFRSRIVLFGGNPTLYSYSNAGVSADTFEFDGVRWQRIPRTYAVTPREMHALVFDLVWGRTLLFGGRSVQGTGLNDTWSFDGQIWSRIITATPSARFQHAMVFDAGSGRTVLFGGFDGTRMLGDTWEFNGSNWLPIAASPAPPARAWSAMAYDLGRARTVLFGGGQLPSNPLFGDTWEYAAGQWSHRQPAGAPAARIGHALAYDPARQRTVMFGGLAAGSGITAETWEYDGNQWLQVATTPGPRASSDHALVHDPVRGRTILLGGSNGEDHQWEYDGSQWTRRVATLAALSYGAFAHDSLRGQTVLFGGFRAQVPSETLGDTWELAGENWRLMATTSAPSPRDHVAMVFDSRRARMVLFGGLGDAAAGFRPLADTWEYRTTWSPVATTQGPLARYAHAMAYDPVRARAVLFGGRQTNGTTLGDTWAFDGTAWSQLAPPTAPPPRSNHALAYDAARDQTVLFGGWSNGDLGDTWSLDGNAWQQLAPVASPPPGHDLALAYDSLRGRLVLGGIAPATGGTWEFDGANWTVSGTAGNPTGPVGAMLAFDVARGRAVSFLGNTWELLPPPTPTWTQHGRGCAGSAGTPMLDRVGAALPTLGTTFGLQLTSMSLQPGAAWLAFGFGIGQWNGTALPIELDGLGLPGCMIWIAPEPGAGALLLHTGGSTGFSLALPNVPALAGLHVAAQALVLDSAAPNGIGAVSNAGVATLR
jgi:hypothetical protein